MVLYGHPIVVSALGLLSAGRMRQARLPWKWFFISNGAILLLYYLRPVSSLLMRVVRWGRQFIGALHPRLDLLIAGGEKGTSGWRLQRGGEIAGTCRR